MDYTFNALDDSPLAVALVETSSERRVLDKLKRNKRRTADDGGWLISESSCDRPGSCFDHPATADDAFIALPATKLTLFVLCKIKSKRDPPCQVMHAPPSIVLRDYAGNTRVIAGISDEPWYMKLAGSFSLKAMQVSLKKQLKALAKGELLPSAADIKASLPTADGIMQAGESVVAAATDLGKSVAKLQLPAALKDQLENLKMKLPSASQVVEMAMNARVTVSENAAVLFQKLGTHLSAFVLQHCHKLPDLKTQTLCARLFDASNATIVGGVLVANFLALLFFCRCLPCCCGSCSRRVDYGEGGEDGEPSASPPRRSHAHDATITNE